MSDINELINAFAEGLSDKDIDYIEAWKEGFRERDELIVRCKDCKYRGQFGEGHKQGMEDAWKIAQTVFGSTVALYEAMDVAKCMKEQSNE